jgi:hypothetical protein
MRPTEVMRLAWMELTVSCIPFTSSKIFMRVINNIAAEISRFSTLLAYSARKTFMSNYRAGDRQISGPSYRQQASTTN